MKVTALILIIGGFILVLLGVLVSFGILDFTRPMDATGPGDAWAEFFTKLLDKAPWVAAVGCFLILIGFFLARIAPKRALKTNN